MLSRRIRMLQQEEVEERERLQANMELCFEFAEDGDLEQLLQNKELVNFIDDRDINGYTILQRCIVQCTDSASFYQHEVMFNYIMSEIPTLVREINFDGETALCFACKNVLHWEMIVQLLEAYPEAVNMPNRDGWTPLHFVCTAFGQLQIAERQQQQHITPRDDIMETSEKLAEELIKHGANVNSETKRGLNVLQSTLVQNSSYHFCISNSDKQTHNEFVAVMLTLLHKYDAKITSKKINKSLSQYIKTEHQAHFLISHYYKELKELESSLIMSKLLYPFKNSEDDEIINIFLKSGLYNKDNIELIIKVVRERKFGFKVIKTLLGKFPEYQINSTESKYGNTMFIEYANSITNIEELLLLGANPLAINKFGNNALLTAVKTKDIGTIKRLIDLQLNPFEFTSPSTCVLNHICKQIMQCDCSDLEDWSQILKMILNHPLLNEISEEKQISLVKIAFDVLFKPNIWINQGRLKIVLRMIVEAITNIDAFVIEYQHEIYFTCQPYIFETRYVSPFVYALGVYTKFEKNPNTCLLINILLESGMKVNKIPQNCITPLTIVLLNENLHYADVTNTMETLITENVNIESSVLTFMMEENEVLNMEMHQLKLQYKVPDVLLIALIKKEFVLVELFLQYWAQVPLALVMFVRKLGIWWIIKFLQYGFVPHGTELYEHVQKVVEPAMIKLKDHHAKNAYIWKEYQQIKGNPLSLQDLCKNVVRNNLTERASQPDVNLPALLDQVLPEKLKPVAKHCTIVELPQCVLPTMF